MAKHVSYSDAGVDIDAGDAFVERLKKRNPAIGGFAAAFAIPRGYKSPRLVVSTDGVGTKLLVAQELRTYDTIGIDLVAMVVNDIVVCGARPLVFLDYFATDRLKGDMADDIIKGIVAGCKLAGCELVGGETAELPGVYPQDGYDLAGFGVGVVEKSRMIDGRRVQPGDAIIGLPSSGLHSNGFSLARKVLLGGRKRDRAAMEAMLVPTSIYVQPILALAKKIDVRAIAHITGGGIAGNLVRVLPRGAKAVIDTRTWEPHPIFALIAKRGPVAPPEMFRTFNMGIGMIVIVAKEDAAQAIKVLRRSMVHAQEIGRVEKGKTGVELVGVE